MRTKEVDQEPADNNEIRGWFVTYVDHRCTCQYCGYDGSRSAEDWLQLQGDHLIPKKIAGAHAEDPLNKVISCFYCNMVKRGFDPSEGQFTKIESLEQQRVLIERARQKIEARKKRTWGGGRGPQQCYEYMMAWIREHPPGS